MRIGKRLWVLGAVALIAAGLLVSSAAASATARPAADGGSPCHSSDFTP